MLGAPVRWAGTDAAPSSAAPSSAPSTVATKAASNDIVVPSPKGDSTKRAVTGPVRLTPRLNQSTVWSHQPSDLGGVKVNLDEKRVTVEGTVALKEGILDYLAVETAGQEYESVLALKCKGSRLHAGLLAIGAEPGPTKAVFELWKKNPPEGFKAPKAEGTKLDLTVEWTVDGKTTSVPAAKLLFNRSTKKAMDSCTWVFTGSFFAKDPEDGKEYYVADRDQDLVAVHYATSAVINVEEDAGNAYDGEDSGYQSNKDVLPASGTPIKLIITLAGKK